MKLTEIESSSYLWGKLATHINERIEKHRTHLEVTTLTQEQTTEIRGRIAELRSLLKLAPEKKNPEQG